MDNLYDTITNLTPDAAAAEVERRWSEGNDSGMGYNIDEQELHDLMHVVDVGTGDHTICVYRTATTLIGIGIAHGPWAVDIARKE